MEVSDDAGQRHLPNHTEFPQEELYGLTSQMRRAAVSIPSNLAEGAARTGQKEFAQFLSIAKGSLSELETQLLISAELGYLDQKLYRLGLSGHGFATQAACRMAYA